MADNLHQQIKTEHTVGKPVQGMIVLLAGHLSRILLSEVSALILNSVRKRYTKSTVDTEFHLILVLYEYIASLQMEDRSQDIFIHIWSCPFYTLIYASI